MIFFSEEGVFDPPNDHLIVQPSIARVFRKHTIGGGKRGWGTYGLELSDNVLECVYLFVTV